MTYSLFFAKQMPPDFDSNKINSQISETREQSFAISTKEITPGVIAARTKEDILPQTSFRQAKLVAATDSECSQCVREPYRNNDNQGEQNSC